MWLKTHSYRLTWGDGGESFREFLSHCGHIRFFIKWTTFTGKSSCTCIESVSWLFLSLSVTESCMYYRFLWQATGWCFAARKWYESWRTVTHVSGCTYAMCVSSWPFLRTSTQQADFNSSMLKWKFASLFEMLDLNNSLLRSRNLNKYNRTGEVNVWYLFLTHNSSYVDRNYSLPIYSQGDLK